MKKYIKLKKKHSNFDKLFSAEYDENMQYTNTKHFSNLDVSSITRKANLFKGYKAVKHINFTNFETK